MADHVFIIGAGPTGLMAAFELARRGVSVEIVDAGNGPTPEHESRALALHARSLDLFRMGGLEDEIVRLGNKVGAVDIRMGGERICSLDLAAAGTERPYLLVIPQGTTERVIIAALQRFGVEIAWNTKCTGVANPDAPVATLEDADGGSREVSADYLIGADGAHSVVRHAVGATFDGETEPETFGLVDALLDRPIDPTRFLADRLPDGMLGRIPINDRLVRYISNRPDIGEVLPENPGISEIIWRSTFKVSYRHVDRFQNGRIFLMGDAAHVHSPAGGRGMNLGLEDAAWFAHAHSEGLLDGYSNARLPYAKATLAMSKRMMNGATNSGPLANAAMRYLLPLAMRFGAVRRTAVRAILAEELPRPPFSG